MPVLSLANFNLKNRDLKEIHTVQKKIKQDILRKKMTNNVIFTA